MGSPLMNARCPQMLFRKNAISRVVRKSACRMVQAGPVDMPQAITHMQGLVLVDMQGVQGVQVLDVQAMENVTQVRALVGGVLVGR